GGRRPAIPCLLPVTVVRAARSSGPPEAGALTARTGDAACAWLLIHSSHGVDRRCGRAAPKRANLGAAPLPPSRRSGGRACPGLRRERRLASSSTCRARR